MKQRNFNRWAAGLFSIVSALHLIRAVSGWEMQVNGWTIPIWVSWLAFVVLGWLALSSWKLPR